MRSMFLFHKILILLFGVAISVQAVPPVLNYAGQVAVNGEAFDGNGLFKFALVNADGTTTYWSNDGTSVDGSEPQASVSVPVNGGLYAILLGNTAQQGMGAIDPAVFTQYSDAKLRIWFSDGVNGFQQLSPDRPFASVPYAFSAGTAQTASSATIAYGSIDRSMLSGDIRFDLNRTISYNDLSPQIKTDINATIGLDRLSAEVILKLEQNARITNGSVTGSKMADGAVTAIKMADGAITTDKLNEQILKYLEPEITSQPQASTIYSGSDGSVSFSAEGKYLTYQWKKDGVDLAGETNATFNITDANATLHDGNYSVIVSNDFGSVESDLTEVFVKDGILNGLVGWWKFDEGSGTVAYDSSGNGHDGNLTNGPTWAAGKIGGALSFDGGDDLIIATLPNLNGSDITISQSVWIKTASSKQTQVIITKRVESHFGYPTIMLEEKLATFAMDKPSLRISIKSNIELNDNQWHQLCGIKELNTYSIYVDGIFSKSEVITDQYTSSDIIHFGNHIPWKNSNVNPGFEGLIDDVRIYDRALSDAEVQALYNLGQ